jgi:hypothetical protein
MKFKVTLSHLGGYPWLVQDITNERPIIVASFMHQDDAQEYVDFLNAKYKDN